MMRSGLALAAAILLLLAAMAVKGELIRLPSPPDAPAADGFDATRAAARLQRILGDERAASGRQRRRRCGARAADRRDAQRRARAARHRRFRLQRLRPGARRRLRAGPNVVATIGPAARAPPAALGPL